MTKDLAGSVAKDISGRGENNSSGVGGSPELGLPDRICWLWSVLSRDSFRDMQGLFGIV